MLAGAVAGNAVEIVLTNKRRQVRHTVERMLDWPEGVVEFPPNQSARLRPEGVDLTAARGVMLFGPDTWFEPPLIVHAELTGGTIQVGLLTGFYGGNIATAVSDGIARSRGTCRSGRTNIRPTG